MNSTDQPIPITLLLPKALYQKVAQTAEQEQRSLEDLLNGLVLEGLTTHATVRQILEAVSTNYRQRLSQADELQKSPEEVFQELRAIREQLADELYPN
jgi:hypothetical protein